jgi:two-component system sensor histidine kinase VicK
MNHLEALKKSLRITIFMVLVVFGSVLSILWWVARYFVGQSPLLYVAMGILSLLGAYLLAVYLSGYLMEPLDKLWRAILHVSPGHTPVVAPDLEHTKVGRELVTSLALQVYQLASTNGPLTTQKTTPTTSPITDSLAKNLPLPLFAIDKNQVITFTNEAALKYLDLTSENIIGKNFYSVIDMSFHDNNTLDSWLQDCRVNKVTANNSWERVRMKLSDQTTLKQFDMAAYYNKENSSGVESAVALFDQTNRYSADDQALSFIALAVHELRTPLTILRGYIEVFEDELGDKLEPDQADFMHKMNASAQQLTAFVNNILNVARVEENQLTLKLTEEDWKMILDSAIKDLNLRAQVHGITIEYSVDPAVPSVGVDKVSIYEVINNLVDNAIKYSANGKKIIIKSYVSKDGMVETTVQDFGIGIPTAVIPQLFEKFQRDHRTRAQIGGTGLGLYLCKAIITAHGGNIWLQSKEDEGSTFGFSIMPYAKLADELKNSDNKDIVRGAHGWIKNHSLYRR